MCTVIGQEILAASHWVALTMGRSFLHTRPMTDRSREICPLGPKGAYRTRSESGNGRCLHLARTRPTGTSAFEGARPDQICSARVLRILTPSGRSVNPVLCSPCMHDRVAKPALTGERAHSLQSIQL
jgi:hypothetical protein